MDYHARLNQEIRMSAFFNSLQKGVNCLLLPYVVLCVILLFLVVIRKGKYGYVLSSITVFMILWRCVFGANASRYFSSILFLIVILGCIGLKNIISKRPGILLSLFLALVTYNVIETFVSFSNVYILDAKDEIAGIDRETSDLEIVICQDEFNRLKPANSKHRIQPLDSNRRIDDLYQIYFDHLLWGKPSYILMKESKSSHGKELDSKIKDIRIRYKKTSQYITNKRKNRFLSIYQSISDKPTPDLNPETVASFGKLVVYDPLYEMYVYLGDKNITWLVGAEINDKTEFIYHIIPKDEDLVKLPENRIQHMFDNFGFLPNSSILENKMGKYYIAKKTISDKYSIKYFRLGIRIDNNRSMREFSPN